MPKLTKAQVDKKLRDDVFTDLFTGGDANCVKTDAGLANYPEYEYHKINDRQWGVILTDANGDTRYVRIGAIVAEQRDDMTAEELMQSEIAAYNQKQADKAEKAKAAEKKAEADKAKREAKKAEKE